MVVDPGDPDDRHPPVPVQVMLKRAERVGGAILEAPMKRAAIVELQTVPIP